MEEEQGYPSSDKESHLSNDKTTEHSSTLKSSNPAWIKLKEMGLNTELPKLTDQLPESTDQTISQDLPQKGETTSKAPETEDLSAFGRWLTSLAEPSLEVAPIEKSMSITEVESISEEPEVSEAIRETKSVKKDKQKKKKKKRGKKKKKAEQSDDAAVLSEGIYSETLAELLVSQGHIDEAVQMYEKMCLIYPEKSRLFAAKIAELIKKA